MSALSLGIFRAVLMTVVALMAQPLHGEEIEVIASPAIARVGHHYQLTWEGEQPLDLRCGLSMMSSAEKHWKVRGFPAGDYGLCYAAFSGQRTCQVAIVLPRTYHHVSGSGIARGVARDTIIGVGVLVFWLPAHILFGGP